MVTKPSQIFNPSYYNEENLREDIKSVELFYRQNGYLDAAVTGFRADVDSTRFRAAIEITVSEGERTRIDGVSILGNEARYEYRDSIKHVKPS